MKIIRCVLAVTLALSPVMAIAQTSIILGTNRDGGTTTNKAILTDSSGRLVVDVTPSGSYVTQYISGTVGIPVGSTTTLLSSATFTTALTVWNTTGANITINVMDGSGNYLLGPGYVLPALTAQGFPLGGGLLLSGVGASASATGAKMSAGGYQ